MLFDSITRALIITWPLDYRTMDQAYEQFITQTAHAGS